MSRATRPASPPIGSGPFSNLPSSNGSWDEDDDAELAYADMLAEEGADSYEVRAACRRARPRRRFS